MVRKMNTTSIHVVSTLDNAPGQRHVNTSPLQVVLMMFGGHTQALNLTVAAHKNSNLRAPLHGKPLGFCFFQLPLCSIVYFSGRFFARVGYFNNRKYIQQDASSRSTMILSKKCAYDRQRVNYSNDFERGKYPEGSVSSGR